MKICFRCKEEKDESEFCKNKAMPSGLSSYCKPCHKKRNHESALVNQFGTTVEAYNEKFETQNGVCKICGKVDSRGWRLSQDHDHQTGQVRDLLCILCNMALGGFQDSPELLRKALQYLQDWGKE